MAYTVKNFKTSKALQEAFATGAAIETYQPGGFFPTKENGTVTLEGPHYPEPHRWYATAVVENTVIVRLNGKTAEQAKATFERAAARKAAKEAAAVAK